MNQDDIVGLLVLLFIGLFLAWDVFNSYRKNTK